MYCKRCGEEIKDTNKFCPKCGCEVDIPLNSGENQTRKGAKTACKLLLVGTTLIIILALFLQIIKKPEEEKMNIVKQDRENIVDVRFELSEWVGESWSEFCSQLSSEKVKEFEVIQQYEDGTKDWDDSQGLSLEVLEDGTIYCFCLSEQKNNYSIYGVYYGQDFEDTKRELRASGFEKIREDGLSEYDDMYSKYDTYALYRKSAEEIALYAKEGKTVYIFLD